MKKLLLIILCLTAGIPSFALCPIDENNTVCTLPMYREQVLPIYQEKGGIYNYGNNPNVHLQPIKREDPITNMRNPNNELNYNSSCQFGVCLPTVNDTLMMQKNND